jgi:predicted transcriptional regulator
MADGGLKVELDLALAEKLKVFASATGANVESIVREAVSSYVDDWSETLERLTEYEQKGESVDAGPALASFRDAVAAGSAGEA